MHLKNEMPSQQNGCGLSTTLQTQDSVIEHRHSQQNVLIIYDRGLSTTQHMHVSEVRYIEVTETQTVEGWNDTPS